jgi:hypothetical protein
MSIGSTTRLGLTTWSSGDDPFGRAQFQNDNLAIEDLVAAFRTGNTTDRTSATGDKYTESFWYDTTESVLYYNNGTAWVSVDSKAQSADAVTLAPGTASTPQGTSTRLARADHSHSVPVASATTVSGSNSAGSASTFARSDHNHALASSVVGATQLATDSVITAKILDLNVTTGKINDLAVTTGKIASAAVTPGKLDSSVATTNGGILYDSVTGLSIAVDDSTINKNLSGQMKVKDAGITATHIATSIAGDGLSGGAGTPLAVNTDGSSIETNSDTLRVKALGIAQSMLATDSVSTAKIVNLNVTTAKINDLAVTTAKINTGAVTPGKLDSSVATTNGGVLLDSVTGLTVSVDDSTVTKSITGQVKVKDAGVTATQIAASIAGDGLSGGAGTALSVNTDGSSIETSADALRVKALGITNAMLAGSISKAKLSTDIVKASGSVLFDTTNGLSLNVDGTTIEISTNAIRVKDGSIGKAKLATDVIKASSGIAFSNADGLSFVPNPNGAGTGIANLSMGASGVTVNGGISFTSAGAPSSAVSDGNLNVDTSNNLLYFRSGSTWRNALWAAGTANSAPSAKGVWVSNGTAPTGGQGAVGDIWITY